MSLKSYYEAINAKLDQDAKLESAVMARKVHFARRYYPGIIKDSFPLFYFHVLEGNFDPMRVVKVPIDQYGHLIGYAFHNLVLVTDLKADNEGYTQLAGVGEMLYVYKDGSLAGFASFGDELILSQIIQENLVLDFSTVNSDEQN